MKSHRTAWAPITSSTSARPFREFRINVAEHEFYPGGPKIEHDGVAYGHLGHLEVKPGETRTYEFVADPAGTHMYHCHVNSPQHIDMGMVGALIVEPKDSELLHGERQGVSGDRTDHAAARSEGADPDDQRRLPGALDAPTH